MNPQNILYNSIQYFDLATCTYKKLCVFLYILIKHKDMILRDLSQLSQLRNANEVAEDLATCNVEIDLDDLAYEEANTSKDWDFSEVDKKLIQQVKCLSDFLGSHGIFGEYNWFSHTFQISKIAPSGYPMYLTIEVNEDSYTMGIYDYDFASDLLEDVLAWRNR